MLQDDALKLLRDIDVIEARMRGLESSLTHIRERLHKLTNVGSRYDIAGKRILTEDEAARQAEIDRYDANFPPF